MTKKEKRENDCYEQYREDNEEQLEEQKRQYESAYNNEIITISQYDYDAANAGKVKKESKKEAARKYAENVPHAVGSQPHSFIEKIVCSDVKYWLNYDCELVGSEMSLPRGRLDLMVRDSLDHNHITVVEIKCVYYSGKTNQQAQMDGAIGQVARYMYDLRSEYFGLHDALIDGLIIMTYVPYKMADMKQWKDDIRILHPDNSERCNDLRHMLDLETARQNSIIPVHVIPDDAIRDWNHRIDAGRDLIKL